MKFNVRILPLVLILAVTMAFSFVSCSSDDKKEVVKEEVSTVDLNENVTSVYGSFTAHWGFDELSPVFAEQFTAMETEDTMWQDSTLLLTPVEAGAPRAAESEYQWTEGDHYTLVKNLYASGSGMYIWQQFTGKFTNDGRKITLDTPEYYSYYTFFGKSSGMHIDQVAAGVFTDEEVGNKVGGRAGNHIDNFDTWLADYHNSAGSAPMVVVLDMNTKTFGYYNPDDDE